MNLWWPQDLKDLTIQEVETGLEFVAPQNTPAGDWLRYWSGTPEREQVFCSRILEALLEQANMHLTEPQKLKDACTKQKQT